MEGLLQFLEGPLLTFVAVVLVLGLLRHVVLSLWALVEAVRKAGDHDIPFAKVLRNTATWVFPVTRLHRSLPLFSYASFFFHVGVLLSALFLREHIDLFGRLGLNWPSLPRPYVDWLALLAFAGLSVLLGYRIYSRQSRAVSSLADYLILVMLIVIVGMGYLAGQSWNVVPYSVTMVIHIATGSTFLVLVPFTKVAHCVLFPLVRLSSEIGWHLTREGVTTWCGLSTGRRGGRYETRDFDRRHEMCRLPEMRRGLRHGQQPGQLQSSHAGNRPGDWRWALRGSLDGRGCPTG
jgi:nitrate reductase gamma subunit